MNTSAKLSTSLHVTNVTSLAMKEVIHQYFGLVKAIAHSIALRNTQGTVLTEEDLFQYGMFGLIDAIERYDAHKGVKFETFAFHRVRGAILDGLRSIDEVSRSARKKQRELGAHNDLEYRMMMKLKMNVEEYQTFMQESNGAPMNTHYVDVDSDYAQSLPDDEKNNPFEIVNQQQTKELLVHALEQLPERERLIVTLYYYEGLTFKEIGKILKLSESRIFQIHSDAIVQLRSELVSVETTL